MVSGQKNDSEPAEDPQPAACRWWPSTAETPASDRQPTALEPTQPGPAVALSVGPVWAWAIMAGHKRVENRTWSTRHRGPLLIHASKNHRRDGQARAALAAIGVEAPQHVAAGAIVGQVDVIDVLPAPAPSDAQRTLPGLAVGESLDLDPLATGPFCWILARPQPFARPIPAAGRQRIWRPDA